MARSPPGRKGADGVVIGHAASLAELGHPVAGLRIGVTCSLFEHRRVAPRVAACVARAADALRALRAGAALERAGLYRPRRPARWYGDGIV